MKKCPYCFEELGEQTKQCPHCEQFIIDPVIEVDYRSVEKKKCLFCGKKVLKEARFCRYCKKWLDEIDSAASDYDLL